MIAIDKSRRGNQLEKTGRRSAATAMLSRTAIAAVMWMGGSARAADECGPITAGAATCTLDGNAYPGGIRYLPTGTAPLQVTLQPGTTVNHVNDQTGNNSAILVVSDGGPVTIAAPGVNVTTSAATNGAVRIAGSGNAPTAITIGNVTTTSQGDYGGQAVVVSRGGSTVVTTGNLSSTGYVFSDTNASASRYDNAVVSIDRQGRLSPSSATVTTGAVTATGFDMAGIKIGARVPNLADVAVTVNGPINVTSTGVSTNVAIDARTTIVVNGPIVAAPGNRGAINAFAAYGAIAITANGDITSAGAGVVASNFSFGSEGRGPGSITIDTRSITATRTAILANVRNFAGPTVKSGALTINVADGSFVTGPQAIVAASTTGDIIINGRAATFTAFGTSGSGISVVTQNAGNASVDIGALNTTNTATSGNRYAALITADGTGSAAARVGSLFAAPTALPLTGGVQVQARGGDASLIVTGGASASATRATLAAIANQGVASVVAGGTVTNLGPGNAVLADGATASTVADTAISQLGTTLRAVGQTGAASVTAGTTTSGGTTAIEALGTAVNVTTTGQTTTTRAGTFAIVADGATTSTVRSAAVNGAGSGIAASANAGVTIVTTGATQARRGIGISAFNGGGGATNVAVGGALTATNGAGVVVEHGEGTAPVNVTTTAAVSATGAGNSAISISNGGNGLTTLAVGGDTSASGAGTPTLLVQSTRAAQTVTLASGTTTTASGNGGTGVSLKTGGAGPITLALNGSVTQSSTAAGGAGVVVQAAGTAPVVVTQGAGSTVLANAVDARAIEVASYGAVTLNSAGTIRTAGADSLALLVRAGGPATISTNTVTSNGFAIYGVSANAISLTTTGATSANGRAIQISSAGTTGDVTVVTNGAVSTTTQPPFGTTSAGILAGQLNAANTGSTRVTTNAAVTVSSSGTRGISALQASTAGSGTVTVNVNANVNATSTTQRAVTAVLAEATSGAVAINQAAASTVTATGGGNGTSAVSALQANSTSGAIGIASAGTVVMTNGGVQQSAAILAQTATGTVTINQTGSVSANGANSFGIGVLRAGAGTTTITATNATATTPGFGFGIGVAGGRANITVASGGTVNGGGAGILLLGTGASTITNNGTIRALSNIAVDATKAAGGVTLINAAGGEIVGALNLSGLGDTVTNTGTFTAQGANSTFGTGADTFANAGLIRFGATTGPVALAFQGLETFGNLATGTIDLRRGAAGNTLSMPGTALAGTTGSRLLVNAFLGGPESVSDRLAVGAVTGTTAIAVTDTNAGAGAYNPTGILVVSATSAPVGAFTLAQPINKGLWDYYLQRNAAGTEFRLASTPGIAAYELALLPAMLRDLWQQSIAPHAERLSEVGNDGPATARTSLWLRSSIASGTRDVGADAPLSVSGGTTGLYDLKSTQSHYALSLGFDRTVPVGSGQLSFGLGAGWVNNRSRFGLTGDRFDTSGASVTGYVGWSGPALFATLAAQGNFTSTDLRLGAIGTAQVKGRSWGARFTTGYRVSFARGFYVEPQASLSYARTALDGLVIQSTGAAFADLDSWRARGLVRAGKLWTAGKTRWNVYASAGAEHEFGATPVTAFLSGPGFAIADTGRFTTGMFGAGVEMTDVKRGITAFARADYSGINKDQWRGASARIGLRFALGGAAR